MCIQKDRIVAPPNPLFTTHFSPLPTRYSLPTTHFLHQVTCFPQLAASLPSPKKSTPLQSSKSSLFSENTRGGGTSGHSPLPPDTGTVSTSPQATFQPSHFTVLLSPTFGPNRPQAPPLPPAPHTLTPDTTPPSRPPS